MANAAVLDFQYDFGVNYAYNATYTLAGALATLTGQNPVNTFFYSYLFNNRLQPCRITVKAGSPPPNCTTGAPGDGGFVLDLAYNYNLGVTNNGNVAQMYNVMYNGLTQTFTYDAENRIISVSGGAATYVYDASGQRVRKTTGGVSVDYLYDLAGHEVAEVSSTGGWNRGEVYAGGHHLATYSGGTSGTTYFIHADWLGTERARTTATGAAYEQCSSLPFGDGLSCTGGDPSPMHFTGKERDTESGLDNFGARYDASSLGRFMTPDWSAKPQGVPYAVLGDPQSLNLYAYVRNNPLNRIDPDGHYDDKCGGGDKKCEKGVNKFDKQVRKDLKSKDPKVRAAAAAWGTRGDHNGIGVKFVTQQQMDADAHTAPGFKTDAMVTPGVTADHKLTINAEFSESLSGSSLGQTVAHEGSHIEDDANFVNSFNPATGKYFSGANFKHFDTEFQAFEAGSGVKAYPMFPRGPGGYQQLEDYIYRAYPNADDLAFPPAVFPQ